MKYILCYGDSNTWGASPEQLPRFGFAERWPGVLQTALGGAAHVYENGLCGRTTGFRDDVERGRDGRANFSQVLEISAPFDLIILMLGTNDCKRRFHNHPAWDSARNMQELVRTARNAAYGACGVIVPRVLVVSPAPTGRDWSHSFVRDEFDENSSHKSRELPSLYRRMATENRVDFLEAGAYVHVGADCVHLGAQAHAALGHALACKAAEILGLEVNS